MTTNHDLIGTKFAILRATNSCFCENDSGFKFRFSFDGRWRRSLMVLFLVGIVGSGRKSTRWVTIFFFFASLPLLLPLPIIATTFQNSGVIDSLCDSCVNSSESGIFQNRQNIKTLSQFDEGLEKSQETLRPMRKRCISTRKNCLKIPWSE